MPSFAKNSGYSVCLGLVYYHNLSMADPNTPQGDPTPEADGSNIPIALPRVPSFPEITVVPIRHAFAEALRERFGDAVQDHDENSVFLVFGGYSLYLFPDRIEISSPTDIGDARAPDVDHQPEPEDIIEELFRTMALREALIPLGYRVVEKGLSDDGYYDYVMRKDVSLDSKEDAVAQLEVLKGILNRVSAENSDE